MYHEGGYTLVHEHVYRVYSAVLGLQFACTRNPNLVHAFLTCTHLVRTPSRKLCIVGLTLPILRAHAGLQVCEMKNMSCQAHAARMFCQV